MNLLWRILVLNFSLVVLLPISFTISQDLTHWSMIGLGKEHGGLYFLQQDFKSDMFKSVVSSIHTCPSNAWDYCLGHPSNEKLALLNKMLPVVNSNKDDLHMIGPIAKQKRLPFCSSTNVSHACFELIH